MPDMYLIYKFNTQPTLVTYRRRKHFQVLRSIIKFLSMKPLDRKMIDEL
jgi:hypothetical protein